MAINYSRLEDISRALKTSHTTGQSFHTSFIYHGSKLLSIGMNDYTKSHKHLKYGEYRPTRGTSTKYFPGLHSEISSILKVGLEDCSHLTIANIRIDNNGNPAISKACKNCQRVLEMLRFKKIIYFNGSQYITEKY